MNRQDVIQEISRQMENTNYNNRYIGEVYRELYDYINKISDRVSGGLSLFSLTACGHNVNMNYIT